MTAKLMFKGEKKTKKRKKHAKETKHEEAAKEEEEQEGWLNPPNQSHIQGPIYMISISPKPTAIGIQPSLMNPISKVLAIPLSTDALESLEPDDVNHVLVCTRVIDNHHKVTLRTANNRYLAADQLGAVSAQQEARGPQEEWIFEPIYDQTDSTIDEDRLKEDGLYALKSNLYSKYLSVDELANGKLEIRCDSDQPTHHLLIRMQAIELTKAKTRLTDERAKKGLTSHDNQSGLTILKPGQSLHDLESNNVRQFQTRGAGRLQLPTQSKSALKKAQKEGRLAEELLDRRSKIKSDRYAK
ncbi:hypothetical protein Pst134EB_030749 [Puccinia striiformis f. sp. tritici]|uniref:Uncharacterized protein n=1 Tax=Puccinia striiformis f. sp. tritici PST-78 TaxID=1165861 RepID=A0A0L0V484_9BASI|nr:hypothetical protein Pst134EB_030749 [Puccinia striiformis f. sp. tritici]KNE93981.1 hypothetical protein PSTG_12652 [Puccinia striiformis f. sp. tritici PST-78]